MKKADSPKEQTLLCWRSCTVDTLWVSSGSCRKSYYTAFFSLYSRLFVFFFPDKPILCEAQSCWSSVWDKALCWRGKLLWTDDWGTIFAFKHCFDVGNEHLLVSPGPVRCQRSPGEEQRHFQGWHPEHAEGQQVVGNPKHAILKSHWSYFDVFQKRSQWYFTVFSGL